jgi:chitinase
MAFQLSPACFLLLALLSLQLTAGLAAANGGRDIGVYWGRNKYEGSLRETCDTGLYKTVMISFLSAFGHGKYTLDLSGHRTDDIGSDIKHCQFKGFRVLLSIGGQGGEYWLPSSKAATDLADYLWNAFLGGYRAGVRRPFGDAVVDGIDFFIDQGATEHYDEVARRLKEYTKYSRVGRVVLAATTRCGFPDQRLEAALNTWLFDRIHVKLFGEDRKCMATPRESWEKWASVYPRSKVFVGVVASPDRAAAPAGYMSPRELYYRVLQFVTKKPNYGGKLWYGTDSLTRRPASRGAYKLPKKYNICVCGLYIIMLT